MTKKDLQTAKRLMKYVTGTYKFQFILVFICILISAVASISVSLVSEDICWMILSFRLIGQKNPDFAELYQALDGSWMYFPGRCALRHLSIQE